MVIVKGASQKVENVLGVREQSCRLTLYMSAHNQVDPQNILLDSVNATIYRNIHTSGVRSTRANVANSCARSPIILSGTSCVPPQLPNVGNFT